LSQENESDARDSIDPSAFGPSAALFRADRHHNSNARTSMKRSTP
jgi:hypothetical protein